MPAPDYAAEISSLETAIGSGVLRAEQDGEMVMYQSTADMLKALNHFNALASSAAGPASARGSFGFSAPGYSRD